MVTKRTLINSAVFWNVGKLLYPITDFSIGYNENGQPIYCDRYISRILMLINRDVSDEITDGYAS